MLFLMYADDAVIFTDTATGLKKAVDNLEQYCRNWTLQVNCQKRKVMANARNKMSTSPAWAVP